MEGSDCTDHESVPLNDNVQSNSKTLGLTTQFALESLHQDISKVLTDYEDYCWRNK